MVTAELYIDQTSPTCVRYVLAVGDKRLWSCRVAPDDAGHAVARARMAAWALKHKVLVKEAGESEPVQQAIIPGRYGRH